MKWHTLAGWAFGFCSPIVVALVIGLGITALGSWFSLSEKLHPYDYWSGGLVLVGFCILGGVAAFHLIP